MKKTLLIIILFSISLSAVAQNRKLAQTGMKFLNVATDPRAVAMGEAFCSVEGMSSSLFYNPAGLARMAESFQAEIGYTQWIADINHTFASAAIGTPNNDYGVFGVTLQSVDYGAIIRTIRVDNSADGYMDVGTFSPLAISVGLGYANALSDRFSVGGRVAYNLQNLGDGISETNSQQNPITSTNKAEVLSFDFGMFYKTGLKSLNFAVSVRNFSKEIKFQRETFSLPLTIRIGISANVMDFVSSSSDTDPFLVSIDAINSRDYPETINIGGEYVFMKTLALRAGYMFGYDEKAFTAGLGINQKIKGIGIGIDYAYAPFGVFSNVNRFAIQFYF
ncbi:MAG: PorV/PorQ family protein [Bacteroidetes bacterium]|nr:PorV/PorQ family protein [Bacteroidota bacterium]